MHWVLALGRLLSMTQTACWEVQPGNEAFGKVAGGTKAFQGFNKRFAGRARAEPSFGFSPDKGSAGCDKLAGRRGDTQSRADFVRSAHPAEDQANSVTADIRHSDC